MPRSITLACSILLVLFFTPTTAEPLTTHEPLVCRKSAYELPDFAGAKNSSTSPDRSSRIVLAKDFSFRVMKGDQEIGSILIDGLSSNIEILWAPDSKKLAINYSDAGAVGIFHAHMYKIADHTVTELPKPVATAFDEFKSKLYCPARGDNISLLGWTADSEAAVIVGEVYPTSDCGKIWGRQIGYLVSLSGDVLRRYENKEVEAMQASCEKSSRSALPH